MGKVQQIYRETEPNEPWLNGAEQIWRYIPYQRVFSYLEGRVFIPSLERLGLNDPFEGNFPIPIAQLNSGLHARCGGKHEPVIRWIRDNLCTDIQRELIQVNIDHQDYAFKIYQQHYLAFLRKTRYAWCWFRSGIESMLMWNSYGKDGIAIKTTVGRLKSALEKSKHSFIFGEMAYRTANEQDFDSSDPTNERLLSMPYFFKRKEYSAEQEVRFVTLGPGSDLIIDLPANGWIEGFLLHPKLQPSEVQSISSVIKGRCLKSNVKDHPSCRLLKLGTGFTNCITLKLSIGKMHRIV